MMGWVDIRQSNIVTSLNSHGVYWESTDVYGVSGSSHAWVSMRELYPGSRDARWCGYSVRQKYKHCSIGILYFTFYALWV